MPEHVHHHISVDLPPEREEGHYADLVGVWHNVDTMVFDFAVMSKPPTLDASEGQQAIAIQARVTTRVRIPIRQAWEMMKSMEANLGAWEQETGQRPYGHAAQDT